jgi:hypothetical protein
LRLLRPCCGRPRRGARENRDEVRRLIGDRLVCCRNALLARSAMLSDRPPDGVGHFIPEKRKYRRPIVLTPRQVRARRANMAKALIVACQANLQVLLGLRPDWHY